jgi:hypothetical protein
MSGRVDERTSGRADERWMLVRVEKNAKCENFNHDQTKVNYMRHLIQTGSNRLDQLKLIIDTLPLYALHVKTVFQIWGESK